jgi:hypothetical protein
MLHSAEVYGKLKPKASALVDDILRLSKKAAPDVFLRPNTEKNDRLMKMEELALWLAGAMQALGAAERQAVFETLLDRLEIGLREAGVGDVAVAHQMNDMAAALHGRLQRYGPLIAAKDWVGLESAVTEHHLPAARVVALKNWLPDTHLMV